MIKDFVPDVMVKGDTAFILIPKCAHKSMEYSLKAKGFERVKADKAKAKRYAAIIREPVYKWITGYATYLTLMGKKEVVMPEKLELDVHTMAQRKFIDKIDKRVRLFPLHNLEKLKGWLGVDEIVKIHCTKDFDKSGLHYRLYREIKQMVIDSEDNKKRIREHFAEDMKLYHEALRSV